MSKPWDEVPTLRLQAAKNFCENLITSGGSGGPDIRHIRQCEGRIAKP